VKTGLSAGTLVKAFGVGGGLTAAAIAGHEVTTEPDPEPAAVVASVASAAVSMPAPTVADVPPEAPASPTPAETVEDPEASEEPDPASPLSHAASQPSTPEPAEEADAAWGARWESAAVARARRQLRSSQPHRALQTLEEIRRRVGGGVLGQEREALSIEALAASGSRAAAAQRAASFVERFPNSPHTSRVRAFLAP